MARNRVIYQSEALYISEDASLLSQIISKQRQYSDKSVYENIDKQINKIVNNEEH